MPTTRIKEKISTLVRSQLPEFISSDYETFVKFIEYYYEFIEQDQSAHELIQNARSYADIDTTAASFVQYILKNYGSNIPSGLLADKKLLIKNLAGLYEAKGSELSFKSLFALFFNASVTIKYPYENVLRASDGTWQQLYSIRVETVSGDKSKLYEHFLKVEKNNQIYESPVVKTGRLTDTLTEVFFTPTSSFVINSVLSLDDEVYVEEDGEVVFRGIVKPTTTTASILNGGTGFKVGQIFKVNIEGAVNTLFQVTKVSATGEILKVKFINYGYNFTENVTLNFTPTSTVGQLTDVYTTTTNGFIESGTIFSGSDYFAESYVDNNLYVMSIAASFSSNTYSLGTTTTGQADQATILFGIGVLGRYPGSYTTNKGFISDNEIRLQDGKLYQPFAYQTNTDIDITKFYDIVKELVHPAGQALYNNRVIENSINIRANVSVATSSNLFWEAYDSVNATETKFIVANKILSDTATPTDTANVLFNINKAFADSVSLTENVSIILNKSLIDTPNATDSELENDYLTFFDSTAVTDSEISSIGSNINITVSTTGTTESAFATLLNYAEEGYFAEQYAGETQTLI